MIRLLQRAVVLTAMLISSIDSHAMPGSALPTALGGVSAAHASPRSLAAPKVQCARAVTRPAAARSPAFSIAPPAVRLVSLPDEFDDSVLVQRDQRDQRDPGYAQQRFWRSPDTAPDNSIAFDDAEPDSLSLDNPLLCSGFVLLLSVALGLCGSWLFGRPMRRLAASFGAVASDCEPSRLTLQHGPKGLRQLACAFNDMLARRYHARVEQSATLAALAMHLESQAIRLRGTALQIKEWHRRVALVEDVDLFSHIATQFIEVSGCAPAPETDMPVESFIRDRFVLTSSLDAALFNCSFDAGAAFSLPRPFLERVMSNLVDNALEHGVPPIEIKTSRSRDEWILSFRDHGPGIKQSELASATSTFVRLGPHDDDGRHWGLGLALVKKLVADAGGRLILGNHPGGGLFVRMVFAVPPGSTAGPAIG